VSFNVLVRPHRVLFHFINKWLLELNTYLFFAYCSDWLSGSHADLILAVKYKISNHILIHHPSKFVGRTKKTNCQSSNRGEATKGID
jgi:hypothetical protein